MSDDSLRSAEREASARPSGETLSRLAFELARASRADDAFRAALRAVAHDPAAEARSLLAPSWVGERGRRLYNAVPWPGLRRLGRVRALEGVPGGWLSESGDGFVDLGRGRVAYVSREEALGVDVLVGRVLWRRWGLKPLGLLDGQLIAKRTELDGTLTLEVIAPSTGDPARAAMRLIRAVDSQSFRLDDHMFVVHEFLGALSESGRRPGPQRQRTAVSTFDLRSGERVARFELPALQSPYLMPSGTSILVMDMWSPVSGTMNGCHAFDVHGRELWSTPADWPEATVDGRVIVDLGDDLLGYDVAKATVSRLCPRLGRHGPLCLAESVFVRAHGRKLTALARRSLDVLWDASAERRQSVVACRLVATRDSLLLLQEDQLIAVEPTTGEELTRATLDIEEPFEPRCALISGRVVIGTMVPADTPLLVVEDAEIS